MAKLTPLCPCCYFQHHLGTQLKRVLKTVQPMMPNHPMDNDLTERAQQLLKALVERYIQDGQPVGSRALARQSEVKLSPASVRNVMADLEEAGFVTAPHTSAGRIPTVRGYRFFVDSLLTVKPLSQEQVRRLESRLRLDEDGDPQALLNAASNLLSGVTRLAGVVTLPRRDRTAWQRIEFVPLSETRVLAVVVFNDQDVENRILHLDRGYDPDQLQKAANYLNAHFAGKDLGQVREALLQEMREARESMDALMLSAIHMAEQISEGDPDEGGYVMAGETNLMEFAELSDVEKLRRLFEAFNQKRDILHLLDKCVAADGVQIFIGEESGYRVLDECSVVTSPYSADDEVIGVLGVIGPTRMAYERVIPVVDMTARLLGHALNSRD